MSSKPTLEDLFQRFNLSGDMLDVEILEKFFDDIAPCFSDWRSVARACEVNIDDYDEDFHRERNKKVAFLKELKKTYSMNATYKLLVTKLFGRNQTDDARKVCEVFKKKVLSDSTTEEALRAIRVAVVSSAVTTSRTSQVPPQARDSELIKRRTIGESSSHQSTPGSTQPPPAAGKPLFRVNVNCMVFGILGSGLCAVIVAILVISVKNPEGLISKLDAKPTIGDLYRFEQQSQDPINILMEVARECRKLGYMLGLDAAIVVNALEEKGSPEYKCEKVIFEWLLGRGHRPPTWKRFIKAVWDTDLPELADSIEKELK